MDTRIIEHAPDVYGKNQFVIACLATKSEVTNCNTLALDTFEVVFRDLPGRINCSQWYLADDRVVVLINELEDHHNTHGESRLLDNAGPFTEYRDYLDNMESAFREQFGPNAKSHLLIFSHYIPCTMSGHNCADVIKNYATCLSNNVYNQTSKRMATKTMRNGDVMVIQLDKCDLQTVHTGPKQLL